MPHGARALPARPAPDKRPADRHLQCFGLSVSHNGASKFGDGSAPMRFTRSGGGPFLEASAAPGGSSRQRSGSYCASTLIRLPNPASDTSHISFATTAIRFVSGPDYFPGLFVAPKLGRHDFDHLQHSKDRPSGRSACAIEPFRRGGPFVFFPNPGPHRASACAGPQFARLRAGRHGRCARQRHGAHQCHSVC